MQNHAASMCVCVCSVSRPCLTILHTVFVATDADDDDGDNAAGCFLKWNNS